MKFACLWLGCSLLAAVVSAQESPVRVTSVLRPQGGAADAVTTRQVSAVSIAAPASQATRIESHIGTSGITYTCDQSIQFNTATGVCNTLNTTIASIYSGVFSNASASIYIKLGSTGLGQSEYLTFSFSYVNFRNSLLSHQTDGDDIAAVTNSVPSTNPFSASTKLFVTSANSRALGFSPTSGLEADGTTVCTLGTNACFDGVITISNAARLSQQLYYRDGTIAPNQYDFYSVVEHETDEILGTGSCAFGDCGLNTVAPADLFRYQSNGARSTAAGNNTSCSVAIQGNACFSLDGVHMLQQYNNRASGGDAGDWLTNCLFPMVQGATGCPGIAGVDISPTAEVRVLDVIGYSLASPVTVQVTSKLISNTTGIVNGVCSAPPSVGNFTITAPNVWLYFAVTGANIGDAAQ